MNFSRAIAWACLTVLKWALGFVAFLLVLLVLVQQLRGDATAQPLVHLIAASVAVVGALLCRALAERLT